MRSHALRGAAGIGGGDLWTPAEITTQLWLDAADISTITESGGKVSEWRDKSGNGRHATQATGTKQPALISAEINGLDVLRFDASDDGMGTSFDLSATGDYMIFVVCRPATGADNRRVLQSASRNAVIAPARAQYALYLDADVRFAPWTSAGIAGISALVAPPSGSFALWFNDNSVTVSSRPVTSWGTVQLGHGYTPEPADADICEVIVVYASDTTTRQLVTGYLAHKWGLSGD